MEVSNWKKLTPEAVNEIRDAKEKRADLLEYIAENLSDKALAKKFGVHRRTIEKVWLFVTHMGVK